MVEFLDRHGHWTDWVDVHSAALVAADRSGDGPAQARTRMYLARAYNRLGRLAEAEGELAVAQPLYRVTGNRVGEATTHLAISASIERRGATYGKRSPMTGPHSNCTRRPVTSPAKPRRSTRAGGT